jgi:hypothetical protein
MAHVAQRPQIGEIETQIRPLFDRLDVIAMEMTIAAAISAAQIFKHAINGYVLYAELPVHGNQIRHPPAIGAFPVITLETQ